MKGSGLLRELQDPGNEAFNVALSQTGLGKNEKRRLSGLPKHYGNRRFAGVVRSVYVFYSL